MRVNQISKMHDRIIYAYKSRQRFYLPPQAPFCGVLADSHASFIYGKTLEYMTDALESTPAGVYGGGCSLDDFVCKQGTFSFDRNSRVSIVLTYSARMPAFHIDLRLKQT